MTSKLLKFMEFVFVGIKVDLVLNNITCPSVEVWKSERIEQRTPVAPLPREVHLISSHSMTGVRDFMVGLRKEVAWNTYCYIIGTQNAGKISSPDIVVAGLGWMAVGCTGEAKFTVWTLPGVRLTMRPALLPSFASVFQKPGFSDSVQARGIQSN